MLFGSYSCLMGRKVNVGLTTATICHIHNLSRTVTSYIYNYIYITIYIYSSHKSSPMCVVCVVSCCCMLC